MVEFGLKLEDNKVEEWAHAYINYEALKGLIAAAKRAEKTRDELEAQNSSMAAFIRQDLTNDESSCTLNHDSDLSLNKMCEDEIETQSLISYADFNQYDALNDSSHHTRNSSSSRNLLRTPSDLSIKSISSASVMGNVTKTVTGIFQRQTLKYKLKKAIMNETAAIQNFRTYIYDEADKVNEFYLRILEEITERLEYLEENVNNSDTFSVKHQTKSSWRSQMRTQFSNRISSKLIDITNDMEGVDDSDEELEMLNGSQRQRAKSKSIEAIRESDSIQRAMIDLHRKSRFLINFAIMNSTGFIKIVKKFNKSFPLNKGLFKEIVSNGFICNDGSDITALSDRMEKLFAEWFCDGNVTEARSVMLPKKGDGLDMDWSQLRLGYRLGICTILATWVAWDCIWGRVNGQSSIGGRMAFPVFRGCGGLLLVQWFWGVSVYVWNRYRINYIFLFDFDPRIVQTPVMIFESATNDTVMFFTLVLLYYKAGVHEIPDILKPGAYPFLLVLYTIKRLIFPLKVRVPMWKAIAKVVAAPFTKPVFFETYIADVFTSMVKVFQDLLWTGCFILSGDFLRTEYVDGPIDGERKNWHDTFYYKKVIIPIVCLFPLLIRFNQCLRRYAETGKRNPNLLNAAKYALSQLVTLFGAFHPLYLIHVEQKAEENHDDTIIENADSGRSAFDYFWMGIFVSSSLYSYFWDVRMDWGLGRLKNRLLGTRLMFPNHKAYYLVMSADLFLRFMWVTTLIPPQSGATFEIPQYLNMVTMALELFRRTIWGFFRIEHEHRHNSQGFRRVDFVPLHFSTKANKPNKAPEHDGWHVLGEVTVVTIFVVSICVWSVITAQRATDDMTLPHLGQRDL